MTQVTPIYSFPYPENTDAPDGPTQIHNLALAVETVIVKTDQKNKLIVFNASGSLLASQVTGAKALRVRCVGGGGGGGGVGACIASTSARASGGGGGSYAESILDIATVTFPVTITVGGGGAGGAAGINNGVIGADSSFGTTVIAKGGAVGGAAGQTGGPFPAITAAGTALITGSTGQITMDGGVASPGLALSATVLQGGQSGSSGMGGTGQYPNTGNATAVGRNATANQGGGGGGACGIGVSAAQAGGNGGSGVVIVEVIY